VGAYREKIQAHLGRVNVRRKLPSNFLGKKRGLVDQVKDDPQLEDGSNDDAGCSHDRYNHQAENDDRGLHDCAAHGIGCNVHDVYEHFRESQRTLFLRERRKREAVSSKIPCLSIIQLCVSGKDFFIALNLFCDGAWPETGAGYPKDGEYDGHWHACHLWMCGIFAYMCGGN
jgi:hypothetical protein